MSELADSAPPRAAQRSDVLVGSLDRPLLRLALPMMVGFLFQIGFNWVDTLFVARLGMDALAAVAASMYLVWAMLSLAEVVTVGVLALVARAVGSGRGEEAGAVVLAGVALGAALSLAVAVIGVAALPALVGAMGLEQGPAELGVAYLSVLLYGYPTLLGFLLLESIFRGAGETRIPMLVLCGTFALNAPLDALLIFGWGPVPALGVPGAALATVIARGLGCVVLATLLWRRRRALGLGAEGRWAGPGWFERARLVRIVRIGLPASAAGLSFCLIYVALVRITSGFGTAAVAALGLGIRLEVLAFFAIVALGRAAATIAGQNLGAGQPERAWAAVRRAKVLGLACMVPAAVFLLVFPEPCVRLFMDDPLVVEPAALYLRIVSWSLLPMVLEVVYDNVASGVGDTVPAMGIEMLGTALRIPLALALIEAGLGYEAIWWSIAVTVALKALAFELWFRSGRWVRLGLVA